MGVTVWHNIVYSTKGGCGKTTFCMLFPRIVLKANNATFQKKEETLTSKSVEKSQNKEKFEDRLFLYIPKYKRSKDKDNIYPIVIIDLDLAASNLSDDYVFINEQKPGNKIKIDSVSLLNYLIKNKRFKYETNYDLKNPPSAMLIRGPQTESERNYFKSKRRYVPVVKFDEFKYSISKLLEEIVDEKSYKFDSNSETLDVINIVYDLPPNSDGYTEILFDILFNNNGALRKHKNIDIEHKTRLFILTNPEKSITHVNKSFLKYFLQMSGSNYLPDQVFFVNNMAVKIGGGGEQNYDTQFDDLVSYTDERTSASGNKADYLGLPNDFKEIKTMLGKDRELLLCSIDKINENFATLIINKKI